MVANGSLELRQAVRDALLARGLAEEVVDVRDGGKLVTEFTRACNADAAPQLVVLDAALPLLDGKNAAILLRSVEDAYGLPAARIVFYTSRARDAAFDKLLRYVKSAELVPLSEQAPIAQQVETLLAALA